jgi:hypothetical protein
MDIFFKTWSALSTAGLACGVNRVVDSNAGFNALFNTFDLDSSIRHDGYLKSQ